MIDLLRARTYLPYPSAYYVEGAKCNYVRIELFRNPPSNGSQDFARGDLDAQYKAADFLSLLGVGNSSPKSFVRFSHESGPLFARAYIVDEREFHPEASPGWMTKA
jgi:methionyl-tRNA formyltransferase